MPFILCTTICCCLPCIISVLGFREDFSHNRGATQESINSLPVYKFKMKKVKNSSDKEIEGGVVAAGTEKERAISGEDAVSFARLSLIIKVDCLLQLRSISILELRLFVLPHLNCSAGIFTPLCLPRMINLNRKCCL